MLTCSSPRTVTDRTKMIIKQPQGDVEVNKQRVYSCLKIRREQRETKTEEKSPKETNELNDIPLKRK